MARTRTIEGFRQSPADLDWSGMEDAFSWLATMRGSTQDPIHHAEGDVLTHTRMVVDALMAGDHWSNLTSDQQSILFASALLHDVAKPRTRTERENGRISNPNHSRLGAQDARKILYEMGVDPTQREVIANLIRVHQSPFWLLEKSAKDIRRFLIQNSLLASNNLLGVLAEADIRGRICADPDSILDSIELFREAAREEDCFDAPFSFPNDETRVRYFADPQTVDPRVLLYDETSADFELIILSGFPGSGKSYWIEGYRRNHDVPVVSLDALRALHGVSHGDDQGTIKQTAKEALKGHLRRRQTVIWDSTNITKVMRGPLVQLGRDYGARIRIVSLETDFHTVLKRNLLRGANMVPRDAIEKLIGKWEPPTVTEGHLVERVS